MLNRKDFEAKVFELRCELNYAANSKDNGYWDKKFAELRALLREHSHLFEQWKKQDEEWRLQSVSGKREY